MSETFLDKIYELAVDSFNKDEIPVGAIVVKDNEIIVDHLHIPIQAASNKVLEVMNRKYDINYFIEKLILTDSEKKYTTDEIQYVAKYFCDLFDKLSRMYIVENNIHKHSSKAEILNFLLI